jgi:hypothetical protein
MISETKASTTIRKICSRRSGRYFFIRSASTTQFKRNCRNMNDATESASWPIPNIAALLARLGKKKADTFGVMDLTSGYHQAPLSLATRAFTAFITFAGVFQFTRLPFGPKRAPSYFQLEMATAVLGGLIYHICEMYLDDYGPSISRERNWNGRYVSGPSR